MRQINLLIIIFLLTLSACGPYWYKPYGRIFKDMPQGGTPGFQLGWKHGCESGMATQFGGAFYQSFYTWKKDPDIMSSNPNITAIKERYQQGLPINWNNPAEVGKNFSDYKKVHPAAYAYCKHTVLGMLQSANLDPSLAGGDRWDPSTSNLENIYLIDVKGDMRSAAWYGLILYFCFFNLLYAYRSK
jgi:hypothetical protein